MKKWIVIALLLLIPFEAFAVTPGIPLLTVSNAANGAQNYSISMQVLIMMTLLSLIPSLLMTMTAFTRIIIVLSILRQAIGMTTTPTNQILVGIALFLTIFIMAPVFNQVNDNAFQPYLAEKINAETALAEGQKPFREFMMKQTRESDLALFSRIAGNKKYASEADIPFTVLMPSYLTSELKTAFQIGVILFIPFLIIDLVVASVLMAMGMMMLSPLIISLPFKIMLFVLIDGWALTIGALASSFGA